MYNSLILPDNCSYSTGSRKDIITNISSDHSVNQKNLIISKGNSFERFGLIHILVNNAAIYGGLRLQPFYEVDEIEWDRVMAVNLKGMWLCCKAVFPYMKEQGQGKIVNISSGVHFKGIPYFIHYTTSKGGVVAFTTAMARELGAYNINVNSVAPGLILTKASRDMFSPELAEKDTATQALHKEQKPEYLLGTVVFLCTDDADYLTGQTIVVDGGTFMH